MRTLHTITCLIAAGLGALVVAQDKPAELRRVAQAVVLEVDGPIGPATSRYIERGLVSARERGSQLVVLRMDTPGGLDTSMRD
ncbi:MAG: NfeD family protein, partial [Steroidobacteraceae bacterium]